jgi:hypothetical protein
MTELFVTSSGDAHVLLVYRLATISIVGYASDGSAILSCERFACTCVQPRATPVSFETAVLVGLRSYFSLFVIRTGV